MEGVSVASETVGAATALAGLILVYLGSLASGYSSFQPQERRSVKTRYYRRAWSAFGAMILALISAALGLLAKWIPSEGCGDAAVVILGVTFFAGVWIAYETAKEID